MNKTLGVLGGGQLGRMLTEAANRLGVKIATLDVEGAPAKQINAHADHVNGSFSDPQAIRELARKCDVLTVEIEHVDTDVLEDLADGTETTEDWRLIRSTKIEVQPSWRTIRVIQDKFKQKEHLISHDVATARSLALENGTLEEVVEIGEELGYPLMLKSRTDAYDGRGNYPVRSPKDIEKALAALGDRPLYAEQWAHFKIELAVMVIKTKDGHLDREWKESTLAYPVVETFHEDSICKLVYAPARNVPEVTRRKAQDLARRAVAGLWGKGVFGVEMFLLEGGDLLINEIAPRPHNSGHYTIEACPISQYDAHVKAVLGLPIPVGQVRFHTRDTNAIMLNILGGARPDTHSSVILEAIKLGVNLHMYGKGDGRPGRKMGHVTVLASTMEEAERQIAPLVRLVDKIRAERYQETAPKSDTGTTILSKQNIHISQTHTGDGPPRAVLDPQCLDPSLTNSEKLSESGSTGTLHPGPTTQPSLSKDAAPEAVFRSDATKPPLVAITMGSDSDRFVLKPAVELLKQLDIPHTVTITSAHRTPDRMVKFAQDAASKGIKVIIAAAGGAAHLPGMIAALTSLPVIGVPVRGSVLDGQDSLLSIVQMPRGCPVATVAINNSNNAAQLAVRILGAFDVTIRKRLEKYLADQTQTVVEKAEKMETVGFENYSWEE
ncbi:phosphoribosylaminoimidazole carboxylase ade2 [Xylographa soralifera]|nr:phosphoribosylaminoimidazole carboxylase ade2 [Xylographa soralifera]